MFLKTPGNVPEDTENCSKLFRGMLKKISGMIVKITRNADKDFRERYEKLLGITTKYVRQFNWVRENDCKAAMFCPRDEVEWNFYQTFPDHSALKWFLVALTSDYWWFDQKVESYEFLALFERATCVSPKTCFSARSEGLSFLFQKATYIYDLPTYIICLRRMIQVDI